MSSELELPEVLNVQRNARDDRLSLLALEHSAREAHETLRSITLEEVP